MNFWKIALIVLLLIIIFKRTSVLAFIGKLQFGKGNSEKALKILWIAERIGKLAPLDLMYSGYISLRTGDLEEARRKLAVASIDAKKDAVKNRIKSLQALVLWKDGDLDGAIELLEDVIKSFETTTVYQNLGLLYVLKGDAEKAVEFNLKAYDYNEDDLVIADNLAESYAISGDIQKAGELYEKILEKDPHFPEPYYSYGLILIDKGEKERGIDLIKESLEKRFSFLSVKSKEEIEEILEKFINE